MSQQTRSSGLVRAVISILLVAVLSVPATAALNTELNVSPAAELVEIGNELVLTLQLTIPAGQSLLVDSIEVSVTTSPDNTTLGTAYALKHLAGTSNIAYTGSASFEWVALVNVDAQPGELPLAVELTGKLADQSELVASWQGQVNVDYGDEWSADKITNFIEEKGLAFFLILVFGFGILMSLSPCIYPMIPITLAVIGAQSQHKGALHGLKMSTAYVVGMAFVYAILGALSATVASGITAYMQSPAVIVPIAILLTVMAFSMFGAFELQAPAFLRDRFQGPGSGRSGLIGVFVMGMIAGLVASPCVGPFLAALLVWVATTGSWVLGFFSLFTFGIGMGLLLIGVGTFPALMGSMPQSGGWMETVKKGMGLLLLAMAFYFVRPSIFLAESIFYPLLGVTTIFVAVFVGAFDSLAAEASWWDRSRKAVGIVTLMVGLYLFGNALLTSSVLNPGAAEPDTNIVHTTQVTPAKNTSDVAAVSTEPAAGSVQAIPAKVVWTKIHTGENVQAFLDQKRSEAKAAGKPIMIDFWATWCVYCKKLDKTVWNQAPVVAESMRFETIKVDATAPDDDEMEKIKEEFKAFGLPKVVFIDSRGEVLHGKTSGFKTADQMLAVMKSIR